jgi:iron complex outermembrane recepter protein
VNYIRIIQIAAYSVLTGSAGSAWAQRAEDNALASAQDAFGTTVGNESIGLYTARDVRGFDPVQAGNVRLEGLYFDRQAPNPNEIFVNSLVSGSSVRVGQRAVLSLSRAHRYCRSALAHSRR